VTEKPAARAVCRGRFCKASLRAQAVPRIRLAAGRGWGGLSRCTSLRACLLVLFALPCALIVVGVGRRRRPPPLTHRRARPPPVRARRARRSDVPSPLELRDRRDGVSALGGTWVAALPR